MPTPTRRQPSFVFISILFTFWATRFALAAPVLEDVVKEVIQHEQNFRGVEVKKFHGRELVRGPGGAFTQTPREIEGRVLYDGMLGGRFIAEIDRETMAVGRDRGRWITVTRR